MGSVFPQAIDEWAGVPVVVLGLGVSGFAAASTLAKVGASTTAVAERIDQDRAAALEAAGVRCIACADTGAAIAAIDAVGPRIVVVSPGFRPTNPVIRHVEESGAELIGDIDLAWLLRGLSPKNAKWVCVTGTDGKTTTVELTAAMLEASGLRAVTCGNIGTPVLDRINDPQGCDVLVVEMSSFQLHYSRLVEPWASAILNVADDHLDWHGSWEAYAAAKAKIYERTASVCVFNAQDETTVKAVRAAEVQEGARAIGFTLDAPSVGMVGLAHGVLCDRAFPADRQSAAREIASMTLLEGSGLAPRHLVADVLAASALALASGATLEGVRSAIGEFHTDRHRIEPVATIDGVRWIDDSKATNSHSADASLSAFGPLVWIVGGQLKGVDIAPLIEKHRSHLRAAVVIGADEQPVLEALRRHAPDVPVVAVDPSETGGVMPRAVAEAARLAAAGDVVLLAPAAASLDQFHGYSDRGRAFAEAVAALPGGGSDGDLASSGGVD